MKIYVACASAEIDRAEKWIAALRERHIEVTSTWTENIRKVGSANPTDATKEQRAQWARQCLSEVAAADVLWLLQPKALTSGAWIEFGWAESVGAYMVTSGCDKRSIFTALGDEFATDEEAFTAIVDLCHQAHEDEPWE